MKNIFKSLKNRKIINFLSRYYYRYMPDFILKSKKFHRFLYGWLIGKWFNLDFKNDYHKYSPEDWERLYDFLFINRIRDDDLTKKQKEFIFKHILGPLVLEVGCGTGTIIEKIAEDKKITQIIGNDISPAVIKFLKKKFINFPHIRFVGGDFLKIELKERFDTVLCLHVLEHIENLNKMVRLLIESSRKRIIVVVPQEEKHPYPPNYHLHFFNEKNSIARFFKNRKNILKIIDGDYVLVSDKP